MAIAEDMIVARSATYVYIKYGRFAAVDKKCFRLACCLVCIDGHFQFSLQVLASWHMHRHQINLRICH